jgi:hypothetical protein
MSLLLRLMLGTAVVLLAALAVWLVVFHFAYAD